MIGAEPNTDWLDGCLELDGKGFVMTGQDAGPALPRPIATSAARRLRRRRRASGSVKRVASGVGEGSVVVAAVHGYLNPTAA